MTLALDLALCALIVGVALASVAGGGVFRAVIFFITYGLFVAMAWARLGALDVALAEAAIGAGLTGVLLLAALGRLRRMNATSPRTARACTCPPRLPVQHWPAHWGGHGLHCPPRPP